MPLGVYVYCSWMTEGGHQCASAWVREWVSEWVRVHEWVSVWVDECIGVCFCGANLQAFGCRSVPQGPLRARVVMGSERPTWWWAEAGGSWENTSSWWDWRCLPEDPVSAPGDTPGDQTKYRRTGSWTTRLECSFLEKHWGWRKAWTVRRKAEDGCFCKIHLFLIMDTSKDIIPLIPWSLIK